MHDVFPSLSLDDNKDVVSQIADIFASIQGLKLPAGVTKFGALTINEDGEIVDGQMPILPDGPWETYAKTWRANIQYELKNSEKEETVVRGWRPNGVRDRIEQFIAAGGVEKMLRDVDINKKVLVHGDFTTWNILFDAEGKRITALLDFDFACVTHPCHEFFTGFQSDLGGGIPPENWELLEKAVLSGNFDKVPEGLPEEKKGLWEIAKTWDGALASRGIIRPSEIAGLEGLRDLKTLVDLVCPMMLSHPMFLKRTPVEAQEKRRGVNEDKIVQMLDKYGQ